MIFLEKGIGAYPQNIKTSSLRDGVFFIKFVFVRTNTMLAKEKREDC